MQSLPWLTLPPVFLRSHCPSKKASLSRNLHAVAPSLVHTLSQEENSILSVATGDNHIYSGSQNQSISVRCSRLSLRALTRLTCRSGTVALIPSRHNSEATQAVCSLSNTRRINTGYLARQVCSVSISRYPQITELITGDSSVRVRALCFPGPLPAHSHNRCGIPRSLPRSTLSTPSSTLTRGTSSPSPGRPLFLRST